MQSIAAYRTHSMFDKSIEFLSTDQNMRIVFNTLEGNYALCLLGNLIQLAHLEKDHAMKETYYPAFIVSNINNWYFSFDKKKHNINLNIHCPQLVSTRFLDSCQQYVVCKKGNLSNWHPILGWFSQSLDAYLPHAMTNLRNQLSLLWGTQLLNKILAVPLKEMLDAGITAEEGAGPSQPSTPVQSNNPAAFIRRAIEARTNRLVL